MHFAYELLHGRIHDPDLVVAGAFDINREVAFRNLHDVLRQGPYRLRNEPVHEEVEDDADGEKGNDTDDIADDLEAVQIREHCLFIDGGHEGPVRSGNRGKDAVVGVSVVGLDLLHAGGLGTRQLGQLHQVGIVCVRDLLPVQVRLEIGKDVLGRQQYGSAGLQGLHGRNLIGDAVQGEVDGHDAGLAVLQRELAREGNDGVSGLGIDIGSAGQERFMLETLRVPGPLRRNVVRVGHPAGNVYVGVVVEGPVHADGRLFGQLHGTLQVSDEFLGVRRSGRNDAVQQGITFALELDDFLGNAVGLSLGLSLQILVGKVRNDRL